MNKKKSVSPSPQGLVCFDRSLWDHHVVGSHNPLYFMAWWWLVREAGWKDHRRTINGKSITIKRGQLCHSIRFIAQALGCSKSKIETFLTRLKTETMIKTDIRTGMLVITICNYDKYQFSELRNKTTDRTPDRTPIGQQSDSNRTDSKQVTTESVKQAHDARAREGDSPATKQTISEDERAARMREEIQAIKKAIMDEWGDQLGTERALIGWSGSLGIVDQWYADNCSETDILPTIREVMRNRGGQDPPNTLHYFTKPITEAKDKPRGGRYVRLADRKGPKYIPGRYRPESSLYEGNA